MLNAWEQMEEVGQSTSEPDPAVFEAIGLNHTIASAFADLVDNSIDAGARRVAIRFVVQQGLVRSLMIVDDGRGMNDAEIEAAMKLGVRRERPDGSLGHFGVGLKAAAFSQASMLKVLSRSKSGAIGRRMPREAGGRAWVVHHISSRDAGDGMDGIEVDFAIETGTAVVLTDLLKAPRGSDPAMTRAYVEKSFQELRSLLGLVFHRFLEAGKVRIQIDEFDADLGASGVPVEVVPINPFGYRKSGARGYPKPFVAMVSGKRVPMMCHIWPPNSEAVQFRLEGKVAEQHQGFYIYRADRLLSGGEWKGVVKPSRQRRLARVAVDIDLHLDLFQMSMEKSGIVMAQEMVLACEQATASDGTTFGEYLSAAESVMRNANQKRARLKEMLPPGKGLLPCVERAVKKHVGFVPGEEPLEIRWTRFVTDDFVEVDRQERVLKLNRRYRHYLLGDRRASLNDVPMLKALLYLVFEDIFRGAAYGPLDKMKVALWSEVLNAVAKHEESSHE